MESLKLGLGQRKVGKRFQDHCRAGNIITLQFLSRPLIKSQRSVPVRVVVGMFVGRAGMLVGDGLDLAGRELAA